jgi:O-antigen ligase
MRGGGSFLTAEVWLTTYLIMLIPLGFALAWHEGPGWTRNAWILATVAATGCLFLTESRAGLLTFIVELWACAWLLRTRAMLIAAGAFTAAAVAGVVLLVMVMATPDGADKISASPVPLKTATTSFVHRIDIAKFTFARIAEYPVLGIGYGKETYKKLFGDVPENDLPPGHAPVRIYGTHNILLETALHVGLPGLALFVWLAGRMGRTLIEGYRRAVGAHARAFLLGTGVALIGLGVRLQFDQLLVGSLAVQFWVLLAAATAACDRPAGEVSSLKPLFRRRCNAA